MAPDEAPAGRDWAGGLRKLPIFSWWCMWSRQEDKNPLDYWRSSSSVPVCVPTRAVFWRDFKFKVQTSPSSSSSSSFSQWCRFFPSTLKYTSLEELIRQFVDDESIPSYYAAPWKRCGIRWMRAHIGQNDPGFLGEVVFQILHPVFSLQSSSKEGRYVGEPSLFILPIHPLTINEYTTDQLLVRARLDPRISTIL